MSGSEGIRIRSDSTIDGGMTNSGTITASGVGIRLSDSTINGGMSNSGTITAGSEGIRIKRSTISGGMTNSGTITATKEGIFITKLTLNGDFTNSGTIAAGSTGIRLKNSTINGDFTNSGTIFADGEGIYLYGTTVDGSFITGSLIDATDDAVHIHDSTIGGDLINNGTIISDSAGFDIDSSSLIKGSVVNSGLIMADEEGFDINTATIEGSITNSGTIISDDDDGIEIDDSTIKGSLVNSGLIMADDEGFDIDDTTIEGSLTNSGLIRSTEEGIDIDDSTIKGSLINSGTIDATKDDGITIRSSTIEGSLTNSGTITGTKIGLLVTKSEISGGIINSGTIGATMSEALVVDDMDEVTTITNTGLLDGAVRFDDNILNLAGTSGRITGIVTGTAGSIVNVRGTFTTEADFNVDNFIVAPTGWLQVANNITPMSGTVSNLGVLAAKPGTMGTITGGYTQTGAGALGAVLNNSNYSQLMVTGTADLSANDAVTVFVNALLVPGQEFDDILTAGTLTSGTSLTTTDDSVLWKFTALPDGNTVDLVAARDAFLANLASPYATEVGQALDALLDSGQFSAEMRTLLSQIAALDTAAEVTNAVDQLVSVLVGQGAFAAAQAVNQISAIVGSQIDGQRGLSAGDPMFREGHWWIKPFGGFGDHDVRKGVPGFDLFSYGIAAGADVKPNDNLFVGAAFAWSEAEIEADTISQNELDIQTYQLALYGSYDLDARNYIDAHAIVGWNDNESRRDVTIGAFKSTASADYDSFFTRIYAGLGRKYAVNDQFTVSPVINIRYTYIDEDGYTETGAPIALAVGSNDTDSLVLGLDGVGHYTFGPGNAYSITARAGVGYDAITDRTLVSSNFVAGGGTFATRDAEPDEFVYHASFGLNSAAGTTTSVSIEYEFEGRQDFDVHGFSATVRWRF